MAKRNYYQHQARINANKMYVTEPPKTPYIRGFEDGFELALKSLEGVCIKSAADIKEWRRVWTKVLTDEKVWNY
jgi:hypothetical protein